MPESLTNERADGNQASRTDMEQARPEKIPASPKPSGLDDSADLRQAKKGLLALLSQTAQALEQEGSTLQRQRRGIEELARRLEANRFNLAVLGQFKRGKSTLINALLGRKILPSAVVPLTAVPTFVTWSETSNLLIHKVDGTIQEGGSFAGDEALRKALAGLVTERENPKNRLGIAKVSIGCPAPILRDGLVLIDTPGIGSTFRHNTETTHDVLAECDAALFVTSADPPVTEQEAEFLQLVRHHVRHLFVVLNKIDYLSEEERREAVTFLEEVLAQQANAPRNDEASPTRQRLASLDRITIFPLSARNALLAQERGDDTLIAESGMPAVRSHLLDFLARHKEQTLIEAVRAKAADLAHDASMQLQIERQSLTMPIEDLERRIQVFRSRIEDITLERQTATDILAGDERRAERFVDEQVESLRQEARAHLGAVLRDALAAVDRGEADHAGIRKAIGDAIPPFFQRALTELSDRVSRYVQQVLGSHQRRAEELIASVRTTAADLFDIAYHAPQAGEVFTVDQRLYWHQDKWNTNFSPVPEGAADKLLPKSMRTRRLEKRWKERVESLVLVNAETVRWQLIQSLKKAFAHYRTELDDGLQQAISSTFGAIDAARKTREGRTEQTQERLALLDELLAALDELIAGQQRLFATPDQ